MLSAIEATQEVENNKDLELVIQVVQSGTVLRYWLLDLLAVLSFSLINMQLNWGIRLLQTCIVFMVLSFTAAEDVLTTLPHGSNIDDFISPVPKPRQWFSTGQVGQKFEVIVPELKQTQFHAINDQGRYTYGYAIPDQVHTESRSGDGTVRGSYSYFDPSGKENQVHYVADASGFRVAANNLPQKPAEPVRDTPEVEAAKEEHFKAWRGIADFHQAQAGRVAGERVEDQFMGKTAEEDDIEMVADETESTGFLSAAVEADPIETKPIDLDSVFDYKNQAVIINSPSSSSEIDEFYEGDILLDAEPIRLLAQLYSKHSENAETPEVIPRPQGFRPKNLLATNNNFDLFQRSYKDTVEVVNPEYVDLRAFLLTNRFRNQPEPIDKTGNEKIPEKFATTLYNQYFDLPLNNPLALTRYQWFRIPLSLRTVALGLPSIDGQHDAQVSPFQKTQIMQDQLNYRYPIQPYPYFYHSPVPTPVYPSFPH